MRNRKIDQNLNFVARVEKSISFIRNLDTFHEQKNSFPSTRRYFLDSREAGRTEIILKIRDRFTG